MNSDLTPVPLEAARARSALTLMGFITPNSRAELATGQALTIFVCMPIVAIGL